MKVVGQTGPVGLVGSAQIIAYLNVAHVVGAAESHDKRPAACGVLRDVHHRKLVPAVRMHDVADSAADDAGRARERHIERQHSDRHLPRRHVDGRDEPARRVAHAGLRRVHDARADVVLEADLNRHVRRRDKLDLVAADDVHERLPCSSGLTFVVLNVARRNLVELVERGAHAGRDSDAF